MKKNPYYLIVILAFTFIYSVTSSAQNKSAGINFSLYNNISTQPYDTLQKTWLNIGLISKIQTLNGIAINGINSRVYRNASGVQISGIASVVKDNMVGLQIAGIANITGGRSTGVKISGASNVCGNNFTGLGISGLTNIVGSNNCGFLVSGLVNITGNGSTGINIAGLVNINGDGNNSGIRLAGLGNIMGKKFSGFEIGGLTNATGEDFNGVQIAALVNYSGGKTQGLQISAINNSTKTLAGVQLACAYNEVKKSFSGVQISPLNIANDATDGVQIGIVNYSKTSAKTKIGLVNINPDTRIQLMTFAGNTDKLNVAVRFKNRLFYNIVGIGNSFMGWDKKFSLDSFYRTGIWFNLCKRLSISSDLGFVNINAIDKENKDNDPKHLYALQLRGNIEYNITKKLSVFGSTGYSISRYYSQDKTYSKKPIIELGIVLF